MNTALPPKTVLHVGWGLASLPEDLRSSEWREIRCDLAPDVPPETAGSITDTAQLAEASVDVIWSSHSLEPLLPHELQRALSEFWRVLRPGGVAHLMVFDVQSLAEKIASGDLDGELYRSPSGPMSVLDVLWGHGPSIAAGRPCLARRSGFSTATLQRQLTVAGFAPVSIERRGQTFELFATARRPATVEQLFAGGHREHAAGHWAAAEALYAEVLARAPRHWPAWLERGVVCWLLGRRDDAVANVRQALALEANFARTQATLGAFLGMSGQSAAAVPYLQRAIELDPQSAEAHYNLGKALQEQGRTVAAEQAYRVALRLDPDHRLAPLNLGEVLQGRGEADAAEQVYREALRRLPTHPFARLKLANLLVAQWRTPEGLQHYREAVRLIPDANVQSSWPMLLNFAPEPSDDEVYAAHRAFDQRLIAPLAAASVAHANLPDPERRLRIGYLSRDFRRHSLRYFLLPVLAHHDHQAFEICCYDHGDRADEVTPLFRQHADRWIDCHDLDDEALAERIRQDGIDILLDLGGYTDRNRLLVVGRKPAPVQIAYLGYPATTGVRTLDYRISDRWIDPAPPAPPIASSERPLRLAHGYFCYAPVAESPAVGPLPFDRSGQVTFGSLHQAAKLNPQLIESWAEILRRMAGARLLIQNSAMAAGRPRAQVIAAFAQLGIDPERLDFRPFGTPPAYLQTTYDVDIALDSFPYNGGTTTCEALWMGVPVVSRHGGRHVARLGLSILNQIGLGDLVTDSAKGYVDTALALAADADRLRYLRTTMRERLLRSPLMDHSAFVRELEAAYRAVWRHWCAQ